MPLWGSDPQSREKNSSMVEAGIGTAHVDELD
jgi:hypothetical protein